MADFTPVSLDDLVPWMASFSLGTVKDIRGISSGIENSNFFVTTEKGEFVLTLFEKLTFDELPFYLNLMQHLAQKGIKVPAPVPDNDGRILHTLCGKPACLVSIFLGDELTAVLDSIENDTFFGKQQAVQMETGATVLPHFFKDNTDRNRTSPFAFTGNKFEFRMPGSSLSVAGPNIVLNTAVAESLRQFYEELKDEPAERMGDAVHELVKRAILKHKKIIFNGNGYTQEWVEEAERRGLYNLKSTPEALPEFVSKKNVELFTSHHIFTEQEMFSRYEILLENYCKTLHIEAKTLKSMIRQEFLPGLMAYTDQVADSIHKKRELLADLPCMAQEKLLAELAGSYEKICDAEERLEEDLTKAEEMTEMADASVYYHDVILADMEEVRTLADAAESRMPDTILPYPSYEKLLFTV